MDPTCVFNFFTYFERILYKYKRIIFIFSWCATHTKIRSKLVVIVTAGSQKITLWGPQRTPLGILRVKTECVWSSVCYGVFCNISEHSNATYVYNVHGVGGCIHKAIDVHLGSSRFKSRCFPQFSYKLEIITRTVSYLFLPDSFKPINITSTSHRLKNWEGILINPKKYENIMCHSN